MKIQQTTLSETFDSQKYQIIASLLLVGCRIHIYNWKTYYYVWHVLIKEFLVIWVVPAAYPQTQQVMIFLPIQELYEHWGPTSSRHFNGRSIVCQNTMAISFHVLPPLVIMKTFSLLLWSCPTALVVGIEPLFQATVILLNIEQMRKFVEYTSDISQHASHVKGDRTWCLCEDFTSSSNKYLETYPD